VEVALAVGSINVPHGDPPTTSSQQLQKCLS
jgi:hypothetical protein